MAAVSQLRVYIVNLILFWSNHKVCGDLEQAAKGMVRDEKGLRDTAQRLKRLQEDVQDFDVQAKLATGTNPTSSKGPHFSKVQPSGQSSSGYMKSLFHYS